MIASHTSFSNARCSLRASSTTLFRSLRSLPFDTFFAVLRSLLDIPPSLDTGNPARISRRTAASCALLSTRPCVLPTANPFILSRTLVEFEGGGIAGPCSTGRMYPCIPMRRRVSGFVILGSMGGGLSMNIRTTFFVRGSGRCRITSPAPCPNFLSLDGSGLPASG